MVASRVLLVALVALATTSMVVSSTGDWKPPIPLSLKFQTPSVNTANGPAEVVARARIRDDHSGFDNGYLNLVSPSGKQQRQCVFSSQHQHPNIEHDDQGLPKSPEKPNEKLEDYHDCTVTFDQYSEAGQWRVASMYVQDQLGNPHTYPMQHLRLLKYDTYIEVVDPSGGDLKPPYVVGLRIEPREVDTTDGPKNVTLYIDIEDKLSGLDTGHISVASYTGKQTVTEPLHDLHLVSGNAQKGTYETHMEVSQHHESGLWRIENLDLSDKVKNQVHIHAQHLNMLKLPYSFKVTSKPDMTAPELLDISINPSTITAGDSFELTLTVKEEGAGFEHGLVTLYSPKQHVETSMMFFPPPEYRVHEETELTLRDESETSIHWMPGQWEIREVQLLDRVHNDRFYSLQDLQAKGFMTTLTVESDQSTHEDL